MSAESPRSLCPRCWLLRIILYTLSAPHLEQGLEALLPHGPPEAVNHALVLGALASVRAAVQRVGALPPRDLAGHRLKGQAEGLKHWGRYYEEGSGRGPPRRHGALGDKYTSRAREAQGRDFAESIAKDRERGSGFTLPMG